MTKQVLSSALGALIVRASWYRSRGYDTPTDIAEAIGAISAELARPEPGEKP